ncbi:ATP phosphoribosyltransferase regulatory subunit [uncultured Varibaculum sp.]|uniref:histidine--tRNA ligase n=1 Tax=uncultured Varibaculum sp. TaxID=413896 RepID=UPI0028041C8F|nr:ATP phosphoribosyltransferase regulatory subunit [uncultured Varibaculum sp.]
MSGKIVATRGMRDFLPTEKTWRERVLNVLRETYTSLGFMEIETPALEPIERLQSGQGGENEKMIFQVMRRGLDPQAGILPAEAVDLGLRYDLTLPLTRYFASHQAELPNVFRAFQTGPVWRAERPQKGRFRQFNQVDIDILGEASFSAEVEIIVTMWNAIGKLGLDKDSTILLNDRRFLRELMKAAGVADEKHDSAFITLDKLEKIGEEGVIKELVGQEIATDSQAKALVEAVGSIAELELGSDVETVQVPALGAELPLFDLGAIASQVRQIAPDIKISFTPTLVRGMGYYTGPIFEVSHTASGSSICGGGRYDGVVGRWLGRDVPAVGFSFGFERIVDLVSLPEEGQQLKVALAYQKPHEALAALHLREGLLAAGASNAGLLKAPRKMSAGFFEQAASLGYNRVLLPSRYLEVADQDNPDFAALLEQARVLEN